MPVGQKAPTLNMSKILRQLGYRTGQSRYVTYYREPLYGKDDYGVENTTIKVNELLLPGVSSYIRTRVTKDFVIQAGGGNIVGTADIYLPRLNTLKNFPNFDQDNNLYFNNVEGWDKIYDLDQYAFNVPSSGAGNWSGSMGVPTSDGESVLYTLTGAVGGETLTYSSSATNGQFGGQNILEGNRIQFQILGGDDTVYLSKMENIVVSSSTESTLSYTPGSAVPLTSGAFIYIDVPYASGGYINESGSLPPDVDTTSIYTQGVRYPVTVASGETGYNYDYDLRKFTFTLSGTGDVKIRLFSFYRAIEWSVHSIRDYTDEYMCLECVRTVGKRDSLRRAYA